MGQALVVCHTAADGRFANRPYDILTGLNRLILGRKAGLLDIM